MSDSPLALGGQGLQASRRPDGRRANLYDLILGDLPAMKGEEPTTAEKAVEPAKVRRFPRLESHRVTGSVKEPRRDTQRAHPIASAPCTADLVALALHLIGPCRDRNELLLTSLVKSSRH
jgi:hypothetical protein